MRSMKLNSHRWLPAVGLALLIGVAPGMAQNAGEPATIAQASGNAEPAKARSGGGYYVEFRAAQIGTYGHSYVVYGPTGGAANYADLHPMGGYVVMALGHVLPVPANTEWDHEVLRLPVSSRYRRSLDGQQYQRLIAAVRSAKQNKQPYWNAVTNNCNHFIGQLAQAIGLKVPGQFQVTYSFVPALRALNEGEPSRGKSSRPARSTTAAPSS